MSSNKANNYAGRVANLEASGRKCYIAPCAAPATIETEVYPLNSDGERAGENVTIKTCGKMHHRLPIIGSARYHVLKILSLSGQFPDWYEDDERTTEPPVELHQRKVPLVVFTAPQ